MLLSLACIDLIIFRFDHFKHRQRYNKSWDWWYFLLDSCLIYNYHYYKYEEFT